MPLSLPAVRSPTPFSRPPRPCPPVLGRIARTALRRNSAGANPGRRPRPAQPDPAFARGPLASAIRVWSSGSPGGSAPPPPAAPAKPAPEPSEAAKPAASAVHDIKLDLAAGDQRVEVRVEDRGGELRVAVHTPDERLAGDLREHLPSLSSRLEQTGLRAESWHAAGAAGERLRAAETGSSSDAQSQGGQSNPQSRERQQDAPPRRPQLPAETSPDGEKGNDFAWLMEALR